MNYTMSSEQMRAFAVSLRMEERSEGTIQKYVGALAALYDFLPAGKIVTKEQLLTWKSQICATMAASTVNVMISAINRFFAFLSWVDLYIRQVKTQRRIYRDKERELNKEEYMRLLDAARKSGNLRLFYLMQTLAGTGVRVSEIRYFTVEAIQNGSAVVNCKGKQRTILIPKKLRKALLSYCKQANVVSGPVFITKTGKPLNRSNVWKEMRKLCALAHVEPRKVFPHNFRHLFAVMFYKLQKDIAKLADLLGHASINTTRIYIMESGAEHERQLERLGLIL